MRTTVTLSDDLLKAARLEAARNNRTVSSVLEEALREHLVRSQPTARADFTLPTFGGGGLLVDLLDKEALAEALGENEPIA
ncbi:ribbon-helix-helix protein, CopG family [Knoellia sp. S7-12]|uniref:ribbon-helix-helix protein, CopG family n=1 Tax=Knoellia sp. S7-12 TaxID=3126698 RepID=UPI003366A0BD